MSSPLEPLFEKASQVRTHEDLQRQAVALRDHYKVRHVVYHWVNSAGERFGAGTYTSEWVDRYVEKDYLRMDPVILGAFQRFHPVDWRELDWSSKAARAFYADAINHGVGNQGYTIPIRGPKGQFALFTLNDECSDEVWTEFIDRNARDLILIAHEINQKALAFEGLEVAAGAHLSPRELTALTHLGKGLSRAQAAEQMAISEHTLRVYVESARHKLGALNTTHAVARALSEGLIVV